MQANPHYELYRVPRSQVNEVYLNGSGNQFYSPHQSEAMENVYYWYDGNVPYCTDVTAWQPLDDNFVHMNVPVYAYIDNSNRATTHQLVNVRHSHGHVGYQESLHNSYTPQHWEPSYAHNCTYHQFSAPPSPCTSIASHCTSTHSSLHGWDGTARSPPARHHRQQHPHPHTHTHSHPRSDDAIPGLQLATPSSDSLPSVSQQASPVVYSQQPQPQQQLHSDDVIPGLKLVTPYSESASSVSQEASPAAYSQQPHPQQQQQQHSHAHSHSDDAIPGLQLVTPYSPSSDPPSPALAPDLTTAMTPPQEDLAGRRASVSSAPKRRRVTRAVQPLACFFCRGRKIACGPPTSTRSGDRTCEPCARRQLVCEYPAESYRGRRASGPKAASVRPPQQR